MIDTKYLDRLDAKDPENKIHANAVLADQWLPAKNDVPYDKIVAFETYKECRLKAVYIELRNFNEHRLVKYSDDIVDERAPSRMLMRYFWDSNEMLNPDPAKPIPDSEILRNFTKLNKKKIVMKQCIKPSFTYKYIPKYHLNEGWQGFQNLEGYGTYDTLL